MRIATWNTQGSFLESSKKLVVSEVHAGTDVLLLQEGGVDKIWADGEYHTVQGQSVGALNERCTNYVLVNQNFWNQNCQQVAFTTVGGGIAGRKPAAVQIGNTVFVSWHALAAEDNSDTKQLLLESGKLLQRTGINNIVIGGDFNTAPANIERMLLDIASTRGGNHFAVVSSEPSDAPTHSSGNVLDFFVVMTTGNAPQTNAWVCPVQPSDHDVVFMDW